jgi:hypothetical protein
MFLQNFFSWHYFGNLFCFSNYPHHSTIIQPNNFIMNWKIRLLGQKMIFKIFKIQNGVRKKSFGGTFSFSNCHIIELDIYRQSSVNCLCTQPCMLACCCWAKFIHLTLCLELGCNARCGALWQLSKNPVVTAENCIAQVGLRWFLNRHEASIYMEKNSCYGWDLQVTAGRH